MKKIEGGEQAAIQTAAADASSTRKSQMIVSRRDPGDENATYGVADVTEKKELRKLGWQEEYTIKVPSKKEKKATGKKKSTRQPAAAGV